MIINFLGDSITQGVGAERSEEKYVSVAERLLGVTVNNYGVSGTRIAKRSVPYKPEYSEDFNMRADRMDKSADFVIVFGGTNDFGHGDAPIGSPDDDTETSFCGALNILAAKLIKAYGKENLCFILPLHRENEDDPLGDGKRESPLGTLSDFVCAMISVLNKNGIEFLNLGGIFTKERLGELTADGLHPNSKGHKILGEEVAKYLKSKLKI